MSQPLLKRPVATPLRQQVVDILRDAISDHLFEPGGRLKERELCELLGVSRSTVREGLRQLEAEGLVQITPNKGPMVADLDEASARHIYAIRARLQAMAAEICAIRGLPGSMSELESLYSTMNDARSEGDHGKLLIAQTNFYNLIFDGSDNPQLALLLRQMRARVALMRGHHGLRSERMEETLRGAKQLLDAIKNGEHETAARVAEEHIHRASELVFKARKAEISSMKTAKRRRKFA